jgi:predicted metal-dependent hydrolase
MRDHYDYLAGRVEAISKTLPWALDTPQFRLLEMKTQWGSCATGGALTLNLFLVKAPRNCIDHALTHELCHLREHNHSPAFFHLLSRALPDWESTKARLDQMAELILND